MTATTLVAGVEVSPDLLRLLVDFELLTAAA